MRQKYASRNAGRASQGWITLVDASGTAPGNVTVGVALQGLGVGSHSGSITVTSAEADNSPQTVSVSLELAAAPGDTQISCTLSRPWFKKTFFTTPNFEPVWVWVVVTVTSHSGNWEWTVSGDYLAGTLVVTPAGNQSILFNRTFYDPIP